MKKRNLGRIAALGLAGLTAIPVVAMTASADVSISKDVAEVTIDNSKIKLNYADGTAWKLSWDIMKIDETYTYINGGAYLKGMPITTTGGTDPTAVMVDDSISFPLKQDKCYRYKASVSSLATSVDTVYTKLNADAAKVKADFEDKCADYYFLNEPQTEGSSRELKTGSGKGKTVYYRKPTKVDGTTDENGALGYYTMEKDTYEGKAILSAVSFTAIYTEPDTQNITRYEYIGGKKAAATELTMTQLSAEFGGVNYIKIDSNDVITGTNAATPDAYILRKGGTTTVTPGVGNYNQYEIPASHRYASSTSYYSYDTDTWYPNSTSFYYAVGYYPNSAHTGYWYSKTPATKYSSSRRWFDPMDGNYYTATGGSAYTVLVSADSDYDNTENYVYYSPTTNLYYLTWTAANNVTSSSSEPRAIRAIPSYAAFFSMSTGNFYSTYAAALSASGNVSSRVIAVNGASYTGTGVDYLDPYYYYYMNGVGLTRPTATTDTSAVTIGNRKGWTNVLGYARNAKSGASYNVSMNGETVVPSTVLSAIKGRNVTVNFTLKNGVVYSINGNDVSSAKDLDIDTAYNTKNIPSKLVSKAKSKYDGVSTSQLSIDGGSFGSSADVTVKFATKRAGCTARLYRYNADRNSLSLVSKSSVGSNGKCTFDDVTKGGDYLIILS